MAWKDVGEWLKTNVGTGATLVGSLLTGNVQGAIAAGAALVSGATGTTDPQEALLRLQTDPQTMVRLKELAVQDEAHIRDYLRQMTEMELKDKQAEHEQQQQTIRGGDQAEDEYVRHTRPKMARQSWYAGAAYIFIFEGIKAAGAADTGANWEIAGLIMAPALAYIGFRTFDKRGTFAGLRK